MKIYLHSYPIKPISPCPRRSEAGHWPLALQLQGLVRQQGLRRDGVTRNSCVAAMPRWTAALQLLPMNRLDPVTWRPAARALGGGLGERWCVALEK